MTVIVEEGRFVAADALGTVGLRYRAREDAFDLLHGGGRYW